MGDSYAWIFIVGIVVFFLIIVVLLCFTRASGSQLFSSISANDPELGTEFVETPAMLETLSEDARLSYERAKGNFIPQMASDEMGVVRCECAPPFSAEYAQPWCYSYGTPAASHSRP
jgi:hypothetical protein